jgi:hypothetical protein
MEEGSLSHFIAYRESIVCEFRSACLITHPYPPPGLWYIVCGLLACVGIYNAAHIAQGVSRMLSRFVCIQLLL